MQLTPSIEPSTLNDSRSLLEADVTLYRQTRPGHENDDM